MGRYTCLYTKDTSPLLQLTGKTPGPGLPWFMLLGQQQDHAQLDSALRAGAAAIADVFPVAIAGARDGPALGHGHAHLPVFIP